MEAHFHKSAAKANPQARVVSLCSCSQLVNDCAGNHITGKNSNKANIGQCTQKK